MGDWDLSVTDFQGICKFCRKRKQRLTWAEDPWLVKQQPMGEHKWYYYCHDCYYKRSDNLL